MVVEMEVEKWKLFIQEARNNGGQEGLGTCGKRRGGKRLQATAGKKKQ